MASITHPAPTASVTTDRRRGVLRTGVLSGLAAAAATVLTAAAAHGLGVSLAVGHEDIPLLGFAQMTFVAAMVGTALAAVLARRARNPRHTFVVSTIVLTALSFVPDVTADAATATRLALALTHVVAAAIVIPALASRLADR
jgi:hypothetical protein